MKTKCYKLHFRGIDTKDYERNPIVFGVHDLSEPPIGKADIRKYKGMVEVTFMDEYFDLYKNKSEWMLAPAIAITNFGNKHLLYLAMRETKNERN